MKSPEKLGKIHINTRPITKLITEDAANKIAPTTNREILLNFSCAKRIPFVPISGTGKFLDRSIPRARGFVQPFAKKKNAVQERRETRIMESFISRHPVLGWLLHFLRREDTIPR